MRITFAAVEAFQISGQPAWRVTGTRTEDGGTVVPYHHVLPVDTMEWRAAEYGIDPTDTATLLDMVLAEPHLTPEDMARGYRLHDAPDVATARRDHLARCAVVKLRHRISTRAAGTALERIRSESPMDPEVIAVKAEHVVRVRASMSSARRGAAGALVPSGAERAKALAERLFPPEPVRARPRWELGDADASRPAEIGPATWAQ
jgi:hypothetical protein